jgi:hypothetical protein
MRRNLARDCRHKLNGRLALQLSAQRYVADLLALGGFAPAVRRNDPVAGRFTRGMFHVKHCSVTFPGGVHVKVAERN